MITISDCRFCKGSDQTYAETSLENVDDLNCEMQVRIGCQCEGILDAVGGEAEMTRTNLNPSLQHAAQEWNAMQANDDWWHHE